MTTWKPGEIAVHEAGGHLGLVWIYEQPYVEHECELVRCTWYGERGMRYLRDIPTAHLRRPDAREGLPDWDGAMRRLRELADELSETPHRLHGQSANSYEIGMAESSRRLNGVLDELEAKR